jgi:hypothetical protein
MTDSHGLVTSHCITLILIGQTIKLQGKSQNRENWGLFAHQPPIGLQYATICSTNNTNTEHKYAPRCYHGPAELPAATASIMDHATVSMEPQMVRPCLLPMILRTPPSSHLLHDPSSSHRQSAQYLKCRAVPACMCSRANFQSSMPYSLFAWLSRSRIRHIRKLCAL